MSTDREILNLVYSCLQEVNTICDDTPVNKCTAGIVFADVRKQNKAVDQIKDLVLELIDHIQKHYTSTQ